MQLVRSSVFACLLAMASAYGPIASAAPQTGWWWNPAESGRGFFVESDGGITFIGAYVYGTDGHANWLVTGGANADPYNYTGELYSMHNGQTLLGKYATPAGPDNAGMLSVHFTDDMHGVVTWPGGTTAIERQIFGDSGAPFQPASGWWWNPAESGSGYSIEVQGEKLFLVGFMYDDTGRPVWYFSAGSMNTLATYTGDLLLFADGQTVGGTYHPPGTPAKIGNVAIDFATPDRGTITFTQASASAKTTPAPRTTTVQTEFAKTFSPPIKYFVKFLVTTHTMSSELDETETWSGDLVLDPYPCGIAGACYVAGVGSIIVNMSADSTRTADAKCHYAGVGVSRRTRPLIANLGISPQGLFNFFIEHEATESVTQICTVKGQTDTQTSVEPAAFNYEITSNPVQNELPVDYIGGSFQGVEAREGAFYVIFEGVASQGRTQSGYFVFTPL